MDNDYRFVGSFPFRYGEMLLQKLDGVTDKQKRKAIIDTFIADNGYAFFTPSQVDAMRDNIETVSDEI